MTTFDTAAAIAGLTQMGDYMAMLAEAAAGYRATLESKGFSPTAAEQCAVTYHSHLMALAFKGVQK